MPTLAEPAWTAATTIKQSQAALPRQKPDCSALLISMLHAGGGSPKAPNSVAVHTAPAEDAAMTKRRGSCALC